MHPRKQPTIGARHPVELTIEQIEALALFTRHLAGYDATALRTASAEIERALKDIRTSKPTRERA